MTSNPLIAALVLTISISTSGWARTAAPNALLEITPTDEILNALNAVPLRSVTERGY